MTSELTTDRTKINEENARRDANTRAGYSKVEPKIFVPPQTPFPGAQDAKI